MSRGGGKSQKFGVSRVRDRGSRKKKAAFFGLASHEWADSWVKNLVKKWRLKTVQAVLVLAGLSTGYRIVDLQLLNRHFLQSEGDKRSVRYESIAAHRGVIFDR
ncbi:MAG: hypothetical protein ACPG5T_01085, partial [Endozoicomonas sp.]